MSNQRGVYNYVPPTDYATGFCLIKKVGKSVSVIKKLITDVDHFSRIPYPDNFFDLILIVNRTTNSSCLARLFPELDRVLKPLGRLCFVRLATAQTGFEERNTAGPDSCDFKESVIYYGMERGFVYLPTKARHTGRKGFKNHRGGNILVWIWTDNLKDWRREPKTGRSYEPGVWLFKNGNSELVLD